MNENFKFLVDQLFIAFYNKQVESMKKCEVCNTTLGYLIEHGRLGCPECYGVFKNYLKEVVVQMNDKHVGKKPKGSYIVELEQKMVSLALEGLEEEAVKIKDEIRSLKK